MRTLVLLIVATLAASIAFNGCQSSNTANPIPPPPAPSSTQASTRPARMTLDQVLAPVNPTEPQWEQISRIVTEEAARWDAWRTQHQPDAQQFDRDSQAAVAAKDAKRVVELREQRKVVMQTLPHSSQAWQRVKQVFDPAEQKALDAWDRQGIDALDKKLHEAISAPIAPGPLQSESCRVCHTPRYSV